MIRQNSAASQLKIALSFLLIPAQFALLFITASMYGGYVKYSYGFLELFAILVVVALLYGSGKYSFKLSWSIFILTFPICGCLFYFLWGRGKTPRKTERRIYQIHEETFDLLKQDKKIFEELEDPDAQNQLDLLHSLSGFPAYSKTRVQYLRLGETAFKTVLSEIQTARRFIFLEYYILSDSEMLNEIMKILLEKASAGVEVRIMYDEAGSAGVSPANFIKFCRSNKIKCIAFNPYSNSVYNLAGFRDHRKMIIIDGNVCVTGGLDIGDEYINVTKPLGHWKDMALMVKGEAVWNFTVMYLRMWDYAAFESSNYAKYTTTINYHEERGVVLPFGDGPMYRLNPSENIFMKIISAAKEYVYITTPSLAPSNEMITIMSLAARSGVDIRIITPHLTDNKFAHSLTRAFYGELLEQGVGIYEYAPGFINGKTIVADGKFFVMGSMNLDCQSMFRNFECGVWAYEPITAEIIAADFLETLEDCREITFESWSRKNIFKKIYFALLRVFAPIV